jgi:hypothetical protein
MNWHQQQAARRAWQTRNLPAHILKSEFGAGMTALCGAKHPRVTVDFEHRGNPANHTCKRCLAIANKSAAPVSV